MGGTRGRETSTVGPAERFGGTDLFVLPVAGATERSHQSGLHANGERRFHENGECSAAAPSIRINLGSMRMENGERSAAASSVRINLGSMRTENGQRLPRAFASIWAPCERRTENGGFMRTEYGCSSQKIDAVLCDSLRTGVLRKLVVTCVIL